MRLLFIFLLLGLIATSAHAWTKEDYEIFDIVSALEASEGKGTTFYSLLGVPSTATPSEISKAYKKKSVQMHPDKNPGVKSAHERFARLGVIAQILRSSEGRERYDFFYKNGVPKWRGTGYYYSRYRPGLGSVLSFLIILSSGLQYVVQRLNYKNDLARIERFVGEARLAAWGPKMLPLEGRRKVKVNLGGRGYMDEDGNWITGKLIDMVVDGGDVFILDPDGTLLPLDGNSASRPAIRRTWFLALVSTLYHRVKGNDGSAPKVDESDDVSASDGPGSGTVTPDTDGGSAKVGLPTGKTGGRRTKQSRKQR
ncbi:DnaJ-domain-containing protein [Rickenella mellea]|uniref:DnaJ-domain-containing protein n=1 Tax=Rickenella mellea TaxID=50990 RepID=A0A4R5XFL5_9AGAM|nr:DnaJ-domain-containing protein [Rickenella mellea]